MTFDETRDNLTDTEAALMAADDHADTREGDDNRPMENRVADSWWATLHAKAADTRDHETTWDECKCEACNSDEHNDGANGYENHVGDGPSGFDYWHDTKWCC